MVFLALALKPVNRNFMVAQLCFMHNSDYNCFFIVILVRNVQTEFYKWAVPFPCFVTTSLVWFN